MNHRIEGEMLTAKQISREIIMLGKPKSSNPVTLGIAIAEVLSLWLVALRKPATSEELLADWLKVLEILVPPQYEIVKKPP